MSPKSNPRTAKSFSGGGSGSLSYVYDAASQGITSAETTGAQSYADRWVTVHQIPGAPY